MRSVVVYRHLDGLMESEITAARGLSAAIPLSASVVTRA